MFDLEARVKELLHAADLWRVLALLGDTGAGKTFFTRRLEQQLWEQWKGPKDYLPLWISLPSLNDYKEAAVEEALESYGFTEEDIKQLKAHYRFLLMLDGYDELMDHTNLYVSNELDQWQGRVLVTSRAHHFNRVSSPARYLFPIDPERGKPQMELGKQLYVSPFSTDKQAQYLAQYLDRYDSKWEAAQYKQAFEEIAGLQALIDSPIMLRMVVQVLPELAAAKQASSQGKALRIGINDIYHAFMMYWFEREIDKEAQRRSAQDSEFQGFSSPDREEMKTKLDKYITQLAYQMHKDGVSQVHYAHKPKRKRRKGKVDKAQAVSNPWERFFSGTDKESKWLMRAAPLKQREAKQWSFLHQSLQDYYAAKADTEHFEQAPTKDKAFDGLLKSTNSQLENMDMLRWRADTAKDNPRFRQALYDIVERSKKDEGVSVAAANGISALNGAAEDLGGMDLQGIRIAGAVLDGARLQGTNLQGADLQNVSLSHAQLQKAIFVGANLSGAHFGERAYIKHDAAVSDILFSADGQMLFSAGGKEAFLSSELTGGLLRCFLGSDGAITRLALSPDNRILAASSEDGKILLWDIENNELIEVDGYPTQFPTQTTQKLPSHKDQPVRCICFSPDGNMLVSGDQGGVLCIWDVYSGNLLNSFMEHKGAIHSLDFNPVAPHQLASAGEDDTVRVWDIPKGQVLNVLQRSDSQKADSQQPFGVTSIRFAPHGIQLVAGYRDGNIYLWYMETGNGYVLEKKHTGAVNALAFTPDEELFASCGAGHAIHLWGGQKGQWVHMLAGHTEAVTSVRFSPIDKTLLASGSIDKTVRLWEVSKDVADTGFLQVNQPLSLAESRFDGAKGLTPQQSELIEQRGGSVLGTEDQVRVEDADRAIEHYKQALVMQQQMLGDQHPVTATSYYNLGLAYHSKGEYEKAIEYHEQALAIKLTTLGDQHPSTATTYSNLGNAYLYKGEYDKAIEYLEQALKIWLSTLGKQHRDTALSYNRLGEAYLYKGEYDKAIGYFEQALKIWLSTLGDQHPDTAKSYNNLGNAYSNKGEYNQATAYHEKALQIQLATLGDQHPDTANTYNSLGSACRHKGKYDKAIGYHEQALAIHLASLGEQHPNTANSYNSLGSACRHKGKYDKAIEYHEQALSIRLAILGDQHPHTATSYNNLGNAYNSKKEYDKAIEYFKQALAIELATLGEQHPSIASSYNNLGLAYKSKGAYDKAIEYHEQALAIWLSTPGDQHPDTATSYNNLGSAYNSKGEHEKAIGYFEQALTIQLSTLGEQHPSTARSYNNLGSAYDSKSACDEAIGYYEQALAICVQMLGPDHPHTRLVQGNLEDARLLVSASQEDDLDPQQAIAMNLQDTTDRESQVDNTIASRQIDLSKENKEAIEDELLRTLHGHSATVWSVGYSPGGAQIISGAADNTIKVWCAREGKLLHTLDGHTDRVNSVCYSPDGSHIISGSKDKTVKAWCAKSSNLLHSLHGHIKGVYSVFYSPDGSHIISGSKDKTVKAWCAKSSNLLHSLHGHIKGVYSVCYSPDGSHIISGSKDKTVKAWCAKSSKLLHTLDGHTDRVNSVCYSPDGSHIISGSKDKTVKVWCAKSGKLLLSLGHDIRLNVQELHLTGAQGLPTKTIKKLQERDTQDTPAQKTPALTTVPQPLEEKKEDPAMLEPALPLQEEEDPALQQAIAMSLQDSAESKPQTGAAIVHYDKILHERIDKLGKQHPAVARAYHDLGKAFYQTGNLDKAIRMYEQALDIQLDLPSSAPEEMIGTYRDLAAAHVAEGEPQQAEAYYAQALQISVEHWGSQHAETKQVRRELREVQGGSINV